MSPKNAIFSPHVHHSVTKLQVIPLSKAVVSTKNAPVKARMVAMFAAVSTEQEVEAAGCANDMGQHGNK